MICALPGCSNKFEPKRKTQKYCSTAHAAQARNDKRYETDPLPQRLCALPGCMNAFTPDRKTQKFCSIQHARLASNKDYENTDAEISEKEIVALAEKYGYAIFKPDIKSEVVEFDTARIRGKRVRVAFVSDTHFGSRYQQKTLLHRFMRYAEKEVKVDAFIHGGDVTDGPLEMHKGMIHEQFLSTYDAQRDYAIATLPETKVPLYAISGNHDESFLKNAGGDIVQDICRQRDLNYIGRSQGYVRFGDVLVQIDHPHDGTSYALSYKLQKRIEAIAPERKPHVLCLGNYHKVAYIGSWRNVEGFLLPSWQAQTPFMSSKAIASYIGGLVLEFGIDGKGIAPSLKQEWVIERVPISEDY